MKLDFDLLYVNKVISIKKHCISQESRIKSKNDFKCEE